MLLLLFAGGVPPSPPILPIRHAPTAVLLRVAQPTASVDGPAAPTATVSPLALPAADLTP